jgi:hypothetical protein
MPGLVVLVILVILAFLAFVFLPPFLRAAVSAFVLRASLLWWLLLPLALAMSALTIIAPAASAPVRHATQEMVISFVISWLHIGAVVRRRFISQSSSYAKCLKLCP